MTKAMLRAPAALAAAALALGSAGAQAQVHGGGGHGFHGGGGGGGFRGGAGGYHGYGGHGYRGYGGPYWGGWYGFAPWGWGPGPYYPGYYEYDYDYDYPPPPPPPDYPPPPAPPERTPAPRAAAASKSFIVYFPFDDATLTAEAQRMAHDAARYAADRSAERVTIVGYTDAAGSEGYNRDLSERRSRSVREALIADGVPEANIDMAWRGKHDQAVRTPNGVREPANRRVTIVVGSAYADRRDEAQDDQDYDDGRDSDDN